MDGALIQDHQVLHLQAHSHLLLNLALSLHQELHHQALIPALILDQKSHLKLFAQ
jgi:hypothetical protein